MEMVRSYTRGAFLKTIGEEGKRQVKSFNRKKDPFSIWK